MDGQVEATVVVSNLLGEVSDAGAAQVAQEAIQSSFEPYPGYGLPELLVKPGEDGKPPTDITRMDMMRWYEHGVTDGYYPPYHDAPIGEAGVPTIGW